MTGAEVPNVGKFAANAKHPNRHQFANVPIFDEQPNGENNGQNAFAPRCPGLDGVPPKLGHIDAK